MQGKMPPNRISKISAAMASVAAASQAETAVAQAQPVAGATTVSVEGFVAFSNFSNSAYPAGAVPFIPQSLNKVGSLPQGSGNLYPGWQTGGYGSFSVARNIDAVNDWRFSAGFNFFGGTARSATGAQNFTDVFGFDATNTAALTERDRFGLYTVDFDFGRSWSEGLVRVRAFAGVRALYTNDEFDAAFHTVGTDKSGLFTNTVTTTDSAARGRSSFFGVGPRVGIDTFYGSTFGVVGNFSAALLSGYRQSGFWTSSSVSLNGGAPTLSATYVSNNGNSYVGNLSASLGVAWQFSPTGQLVVGYKLDQWYHVRETFTFAGFDKKEDVLIMSPFIRATLRF
jgi:Legionella pneumophila major outer membrane protein precursor